MLLSGAHGLPHESAVAAQVRSALLDYARRKAPPATPA